MHTHNGGGSFDGCMLLDYGLVHVDDRKDGRTMDGRREIPTGAGPEIGRVYLGQNRNQVSECISGHISSMYLEYVLYPLKGLVA